MKINKLIEVQKILQKIAFNPKISHRDFRIFVCWFLDAKDFKATQTEIGKRLGLPRASVSRGFKKLTELGVLKKTGFYKIKEHTIPVYEMTFQFSGNNLTTLPSKQKTSIKTEEYFNPKDYGVEDVF